MEQRIEETTARLPWLVLKRDGKISGYAYASTHRSRAAYAWSVDVSAYVDESCRGTGVGRTLYTALLEILTTQGFYNAYAGITLPNTASIRLHESVEFRPVGTYQEVGYKLGTTWDGGSYPYRRRADVRSLSKTSPPRCETRKDFHRRENLPRAD